MKWILSILALTFATIIGVIVFYPFYPLRYYTEIRQYAAEFDIKPELVASVIYAESGFNKSAVSNRGAVGLMQIMPATAQEIASNLGVENYSDDMLYDPDVNIRFGCYYLKYLYNRFGDNTLMLASYNAGPSVVYRWLSSNEYTTNGVLTTIPYKQTDEYVKKVNKALKHYVKEFDGRSPKINT